MLALARKPAGIKLLCPLKQATCIAFSRGGEGQRRQEEDRIDLAQRAAERAARRKLAVAYVCHDVCRLRSLIGWRDRKTATAFLSEVLGERSDCLARHGRLGILRHHPPTGL